MRRATKERGPGGGGTETAGLEVEGEEEGEGEGEEEVEVSSPGTPVFRVVSLMPRPPEVRRRFARRRPAGPICGRAGPRWRRGLRRPAGWRADRSGAPGRGCALPGTPPCRCPGPERRPG